MYSDTIDFPDEMNYTLFDQTQTNVNISSPSSWSSSSISSFSKKDLNDTINLTDEERPRKRRQHTGYACDKCRERRIGCDRAKPTCGQCHNRYNCKYSNHTLQIDNISMRQRLENLEGQVDCLTSILNNLENDYRFKSLSDWAIHSGWPIIEHQDGLTSIFTTIRSFEDLRDLLTLQSPTPPHLTPTQPEHTFTLFDSLDRYHNPPSPTPTLTHLDPSIQTRLIRQHHQCSFPILVSPARLEHHHREGQLQSGVLSSIFCHAVPHCAIYHPGLAQLEGGSRFYGYSNERLGMDESPTLSSIHQRTLLIMYDLDVGRVRRAFLQIGLAVRMCFMLNLHLPEGYVGCKTAFEREQSKRIFWSVWFYDNMVPHLFHDQLSTIKSNQIKIELPTPLPEFDTIELDQTSFAVRLIQIRSLAGLMVEANLKPRDLIGRFRPDLLHYYRESPVKWGEGLFDTSIWARRSYFCILLDYCLCWVTLYRGALPSSLSKNPVTSQEKEAILHTSQASVAMVQLFQDWFDMSERSTEGFDCFFRPYLYHFMSAKHIFTANISQSGRSESLVSISRAYLVVLLKLYKTTPTRNSVEESALEKSITNVLDNHGISQQETVYQPMVEEALVDDPMAHAGMSIFSYLP